MQQDLANGGLGRRHFIGGSDARIIMGQDEKALIRLWQEKRGEVGPDDPRITTCDHLFFALRNRTPAPPPFSSINSTPADSIAFCNLPRASSETCGPKPPSRRLMVGTDRSALKASSVCDNPKSARAARSCSFVTNV
jgi:hypothetical protein